LATLTCHTLSTWCVPHPAVRLWTESRAGSRIVQDGHSVVFSGDECAASEVDTPHEMEDQPLADDADLLDAVHVSPWSIVGVSSADLALERWEMKPGSLARRTLRKATGLSHNVDVRLFVEHVAEMVFLLLGCGVHVFHLHELTHVYTVTHVHESCVDDSEVLARWDYGGSFILYRNEGNAVSVWSTRSGCSKGHVKARCAAVCCDITGATGVHSESHLNVVIAVLEVNGEIRVHKEVQGIWVCFATIGSGPQIFVEVKLEGALILAASHAKDGVGGSVWLWSLHPGGVRWPRLRSFSSQPDRVEVRHGGSFLEVCLPSSGTSQASCPLGVVDVQWLDPLSDELRPLLKMESVVGDWRCDVRDRFLVAEDSGRQFRIVPLWNPLHEMEVSGKRSSLALCKHRLTVHQT